MHKTMYKQGQLSEFKRGMIEVLYEEFPFIGFNKWNRFTIQRLFDPFDIDDTEFSFFGIE